MASNTSADEIKRYGKQVRDFRHPSVAAIYGIHADKTRPADLLGTGTFIQHRDDFFVLTAKHVVENSHNYAHVFHSVNGKGDLTVPFRLGWTGFAQDDGDLALWGCFAEFVEKSRIQSVPIVEPFGTTDDCEDAVFMASGWPGEKALLLHYMREYRISMHTVMGRTLRCDGIPPECFAFSCVNDISYGGMSGSAVWNMNFHRCRTAKDWTPQLSTFAGVLTHWNETNAFLLVTRAETVRRFLIGAIEGLRKQWLEDGSKDGQSR